MWPWNWRAQPIELAPGQRWADGDTVIPDGRQRWADLLQPDPPDQSAQPRPAQRAAG